MDKIDEISDLKHQLNDKNIQLEESNKVLKELSKDMTVSFMDDDKKTNNTKDDSDEKDNDHEEVSIKDLINLTMKIMTVIEKIWQ